MKEKVKMTLNLAGVHGNAFNIMGAFKRAAKRSGWDNEKIDAVLKEAMSSDYEHLLKTISSHIED